MPQAYCVTGTKGPECPGNPQTPHIPLICLHAPPPPGSQENLVLTVVLVDQSIADLIGCDLPVGFSWFCPAQLGHRRRNYIESQPSWLTGHWKGGGRALLEKFRIKDQAGLKMYSVPSFSLRCNDHVSLAFSIPSIFTPFSYCVPLCPNPLLFP